MYSQFMMHGQKNIKKLLVWSPLGLTESVSTKN